MNSDLLVGSLTILMGVLCVLAAAMQWEFFFKLRKIHWIESRWGRTVARVVFVGLGLLFVAFGVAIANGFRLPLF